MLKESKMRSKFGTKFSTCFRDPFDDWLNWKSLKGRREENFIIAHTWYKYFELQSCKTVRFSYDKFEMSYSQGNIMGEVCNNVLRSSLTHIQLSRQTGKDNVFSPLPLAFVSRLITKRDCKNPLNTRYYTHNYIVLNSIKSWLFITPCVGNKM